MDQELRSYLDQRFSTLDQRFSALDQKIDTLREETKQRFEQVDRRFERLEEQVHQTRILVEDMRGNTRLLAEAWVGFSEKQEELRGEIGQEFKEVRATVRLPYEDLDRRLKVQELRARNEGRDPLEIVREVQARMAAGLPPFGPAGST